MKKDEYKSSNSWSKFKFLIKIKMKKKIKEKKVLGRRKKLGRPKLKDGRERVSIS